MLWAYLRMLRRRAVRWGTGGAVTIVFFLVAALIGLPQWAIFVAGIIGDKRVVAVGEMTHEGEHPSACRLMKPPLSGVNRCARRQG